MNVDKSVDNDVDNMKRNIRLNGEDDTVRESEGIDMSKRKKESITVPNKVNTWNILSLIDPSIRVENMLLRGTFVCDSDWAIKTFFVIVYHLQMQPNDEYEASISMSSLADMLGWKKTSTYMYDLVKRVQDSLRQMNVKLYSDKNLGFVNVFEMALYTDGVLRVKFTRTIGQYVVGTRSQYTSLQLRYILNFNNTRYRSTVLLYSYFRSFAWNINSGQDHVELHMTLDQLKSHAGLVGKTGATIAYKDFVRRHLKPALQQINTITDISVTYKPCYGGVGGAVIGINIMIRWQSDLRLCGATQEDENSLIEKFGSRFSIEQLAALYIAAKKDIDMISRNIEKLDFKVDCKTVRFGKDTSGYFVYLQNMIESDANNTGDEVVTAKEQISAGKKIKQHKKNIAKPEKNT